MIRERQKGELKLHFKTHPRAHIGYLVGYRRNSIWRIWVPELARVIVSRNVTFDEDIFYIPGRDLPGQSLQVSEEALESIIVRIDEGQDAGRILGNVFSRAPAFDPLDEQPSAPLTLRLGTPIPDDLPNPSASQESGVGTSGATHRLERDDSSLSPPAAGLLTPEYTPVPGQHSDGGREGHSATLVTEDYPVAHATEDHPASHIAEDYPARVAE
jgi:hypothetical protein